MNSSNHAGRSHKRSFEFCESLAGLRDKFPGASSSLRSEDGLDDFFWDMRHLRTVQGEMR